MEEGPPMITLIDRADGTPLSTLSAEDFVVLQDNLVLESEQDFDYYLNDATLELLASAGMSAETITALSARMRHRGMDVGWEQPGQGSLVHSGSVVGSHSQPLGGIRVDLVSGTAIVNWAYSRNDGSFEIVADRSGDYLRFSGRGDLILRQDPVEEPGDQGEFEMQTIRGTVQTETDKPLPGVNVMLTDWRSAEPGDSTSWAALGGQRSWGDTDDEGRFAIPVNLPEDKGPLEIELELTTVGGETLEMIVLTISPDSGLDLGVLRAPEPTPPETLEADLAEVASE
jgi:hypothetical protein